MLLFFFSINMLSHGYFDVFDPLKYAGEFVPELLVPEPLCTPDPEWGNTAEATQLQSCIVMAAGIITDNYTTAAIQDVSESWKQGWRNGQGTDQCRDHFLYAPSQWETTLQSNVVSHWLGAYTNDPCQCENVKWGFWKRNGLHWSVWKWYNG